MNCLFMGFCTYYFQIVVGKTEIADGKAWAGEVVLYFARGQRHNQLNPRMPPLTVSRTVPSTLLVSALLGKDKPFQMFQ